MSDKIGEWPMRIFVGVVLTLALASGIYHLFIEKKAVFQDRRHECDCCTCNMVYGTAAKASYSRVAVVDKDGFEKMAFYATADGPTILIKGKDGIGKEYDLADLLKKVNRWLDKPSGDKNAD